MTSSDLTAFARDLGTRTRVFVIDHVDKAFTSLNARVVELERRPAVSGPIGEKGADGIDGRDGRDGKDADESRVAALEAEIATLKAQLATPQPDVPAMVVAEVARRMADVYVPQDGKDGKDGTSVTVADVEPFIASEVAKAVAQLPTPKDGHDGKDGTSVSLPDLLTAIESEAKKAVAGLPLPKDGHDGKDGESVDPSHVEALVKSIVEPHLASLPVPENGKDGVDGNDGASVTVDDVKPLIAAEVEKAVSAIQVPKDGIGVVGALLDRAGHLVLTLSDGATKDVGLVAGKDVDVSEVVRMIESELAKWPRPKDGQDGKDGLGFDDMDLACDERGCLLRFTQGDRTKEYWIPVPTDHGVYKAGQTYPKGAGVTWAGSFWIAQAETSEKPGDGVTAWRLAVKRGADGRQGPIGKEGPQGPRGDKGPEGRGGGF